MSSISEFIKTFQGKSIVAGILTAIVIASLRQLWTGILILGLLVIRALGRRFRETATAAPSLSEGYSCSLDDVKRLLDLAPGPMALITKEDWKLVQINLAAADFLATAAGKCMIDFFGTDKEVRLAWSQLLRYGGAEEMELPLYRPNGGALVMVLTSDVSLEGNPHLILSMTDITAKHIQAKRLEELAAIDEMTGLLNRRAFLEKLVLTLLNAKEEKRGLCLAYMDLDDLKKVNDTYGHREGDWYITTFATLLRNGVSENDFIGRVGGDEFAIVFTKYSQQAVETCIRQLQQQLELTALHIKKNYTMQVSVGLVAVTGGEDIDVSSLLQKADYAMYQQKCIRHVCQHPL